MSDIQTELKQFAEVFNSELKHYFPCPEGEEKRVIEDGIFGFERRKTFASVFGF